MSKSFKILWFLSIVFAAAPFGFASREGFG